MQAKTHEFTGIAMALCTAALTATPDISALTYTTTLVAGAAVGSLIPDIDHKGSKISKEHKVISKMVSGELKHRGITHSIVANLLVAVVCFGFAFMFESLYNGNFIGRITLARIMTSVFHLIYMRYDKIRDVVHSVVHADNKVVCLVVFLLFYLSANLFVEHVFYIAIGVVVGYFSHLFADACTVSGVAFFQPFSDKTFNIAHFKTGENEEIFRGIVGAITSIIVILAIIF